MATKKDEKDEEERQYQLAEKERKAEMGKPDPSPSAAGNAPGKLVEEVKPAKPEGPVAPGAADSGKEAPSVEKNKPDTPPQGEI